MIFRNAYQVKTCHSFCPFMHSTQVNVILWKYLESTHVCHTHARPHARITIACPSYIHRQPTYHTHIRCSPLHTLQGSLSEPCMLAPTHPSHRLALFLLHAPTSVPYMHADAHNASIFGNILTRLGACTTISYCNARNIARSTHTLVNTQIQRNGSGLVSQCEC